MIRLSQSVRTSGAGAGAAALELIASTSRGFWLRELHISLVAATTSVYACGRPAAKGVTPTAPVILNAEASGDPTTGAVASALAWATPPTVPVYFYRRVSMPANIGDKTTWTFAQLWVPASASFVLWNIAANSVADVNIVIDEPSV